MKVLKTNVKAEHCGEAPVDFMYAAEKEVLLDDDKTKLYVHIQVVPDGSMFYAVNTSSLFKKGKELNDPLEMYGKLRQASKSKYYKLFKELDKIINEKIQETMSNLDDTKMFGGIRFGAQFNSKGLNLYLEAVGHITQCEKYIYMQVMQIDGKSHYSLTDTSIFMRIEMGDLYPAYFGEKPEVPFLIETDDLEQLGEYEFLKDTYEELDRTLLERFEELKKQQID